MPKAREEELVAGDVVEFEEEGEEEEVRMRLEKDAARVSKAVVMSVCQKRAVVGELLAEVIWAASSVSVGLVRLVLRVMLKSAERIWAKGEVVSLVRAMVKVEVELESALEELVEEGSADELVAWNSWQVELDQQSLEELAVSSTSRGLALRSWPFLCKIVGG